MMKLEDFKKLVIFCKRKGLKYANFDGCSMEFYEPSNPVAPPMDLSPLNLAKALQDSMPPDSAMLFAATEPVIEKITE